MQQCQEALSAFPNSIFTAASKVFHSMKGEWMQFLLFRETAICKSHLCPNLISIRRTMNLLSWSGFTHLSCQKVSACSCQGDRARGSSTRHPPPRCLAGRCLPWEPPPRHWPWGDGNQVAKVRAKHRANADWITHLSSVQYVECIYIFYIFTLKSV